jgi:hypothetical protein
MFVYLRKKKMEEAFKHFFGLCGEGHPSFLYTCGLIPFLLWFKGTIRLYYRLTILSVKSFLKRLR